MENNSISAVIGWFLSLLPGVFLFWKYALPKLEKSLLSMTSSGGVIAVILGAIIKFIFFVIKFPMFLVEVISSIPLNIFKLISKFTFNFRFAAILSLTLSNYFSNLFENLFLLVGAVSIKIGLIFVKWGKSFIDGMQQNNTSQLKSLLGESVGSLPPCMVDVMGYMHLVENIGMLVTTLIFCGVIKIIYSYVLKFR